MAQNVTIAGASYTDVTAIEVPKTTSGVASFHDVTDTTATASDVAQGKYFYTADGVKTAGALLPATITETLDANGGYVLEVTGGLDLSNDTVTAERLLFGYTAHDRSGAAITGTATNPVPENDVMFIDYDGTLLYSYSSHEFGGLTAMPANPTHTGLTSQGWNWTLSDAKSYASTYGALVIGQSYVTSDGKTRLYIDIPHSSLLSFGISISGANSSGIIDWGDSSSNDTFSGNAIIYHEYSAIGEYVITIEITTGSITLKSSVSSNISYYGVLRYPASFGTLTNVERSKPLFNILKHVELGNNISIGVRAFEEYNSLETITLPIGSVSSSYSTSTHMLNRCSVLKTVVIPSGVTALGQNTLSGLSEAKYISLPKSLSLLRSSMFSGDESLETLTISEDITTLDESVFYACYKLKKICGLNNITTINNRAFYYCKSLLNFEIPPNLTTYGTYVFYECEKIREIDLGSNITTIKGNTFGYTFCLSEITIPSSVTTIEAYGIYSAYGLLELHFKSQTPPTLSSSLSVNLVNTACKIYVPTGSLAAYTSATNYPSSSTYTYIEE